MDPPSTRENLFPPPFLIFLAQNLLDATKKYTPSFALVVFPHNLKKKKCSHFWRKRERKTNEFYRNCNGWHTAFALQNILAWQIYEMLIQLEKTNIKFHY